MMTAPIRASRRARRQDGQAYVEFALVLPLLLLIVMGIVQFGTVFKDYIALTDATRAGARQASVSLSVPDASQRVALVEQRMKDSAGTLDTSKMVISVKPWDPNKSQEAWVAGGDVTVRASYPLKINLFGLVIFDSTMNSRTTERVE